MQKCWNVGYISESIKITINNIVINTRFFQNEMEADIAPREFQSNKDYESLISYMKKISILLNKKLFVSSE